MKIEENSLESKTPDSVENTLMVIQHSAHLPINIEPIISRKWVLNGNNNSNWQMYQDAFDDSPTNSSIIKGTVEYIFADGLIDLNGDSDIQKEFNVSKHLSASDAKLICNDYKKFGGFAVQVIWNSAKDIEDKRPLLVKYFKIFKLGLSIDECMEVNGYWYSFDWSKYAKYKPVYYPMYTGEYKGNDVELIVFQQPTSNDFFAQPDYVSAIRYAQIEGELQNWAYNHLLNGFQGSVLINVNGGVPATEELRRRYRKDLLGNTTGSINAGKAIVSFNKSKEQAIDVITIPVLDLNQQYVQMSTDSREQLIAAHQASPVIFANTKDGNGLSNNAAEMEMATKAMYRKVIRPMQKDILTHLMTIFKDIENPVKDDDGNIIYKKIELAFKDFESFAGDNRKDIKQ